MPAPVEGTPPEVLLEQLRAAHAELDAFLPIAGSAAAPEGPVGFRLQGEDVDLSLAYDGAARSTADTGEVAVTFRGRDSDLVLFALGRGSIADRHLEVDGDLIRADDFRVHVPGL